mgnify:CR=1 FL=1
MKKNEEMIVLGIDPGTATTGWGVVKCPIKYVAHGAIKTPVGMIMGERLLMLHTELTKVIVKYKPQVMVIEQLFFGRNAKTGITVGQARGVIMMAAAQAHLEPFEYQGLWVKKKLCGDGHADKKKIQETVRKILKLRLVPKPDDAADALGLAICYLQNV